MSFLFHSLHSKIINKHVLVPNTSQSTEHLEKIKIKGPLEIFYQQYIFSQIFLYTGLFLNYLIEMF